MENSNQDVNELLIFMHIPKTGGTTLSHILKKQYQNAVCGGGSQNHTIKRLSNLSEKEAEDTKCIWGHIPFGIHHYFSRPYSYITILRDPIERVISMYYYLSNNPKIKWIDDMSFKEFINHDGVKSKIENLQTRLLSWESQVVDYERTEENITRFVLESKQDVPNLRRAKKNLEQYFSIVGITEMFNESISLMKHELGWGNINYRNKNVNFNRPKQEQLSSRIVNIIKEKNILDLKLYNYTKKRLKGKIDELSLSKEEF